jgi:hypothetical protein
MGYKRTYYINLVKKFDVADPNQCSPSDCATCQLGLQSKRYGSIEKTLCQWLDDIVDALGHDTVSPRIRVENYTELLKSYGTVSGFCETVSCTNCPLDRRTANGVSVCSMLSDIRNRLDR